MTLRIVGAIVAGILSIPWVSSFAKYLWHIYVTVNLSRIKKRDLVELYRDIKSNHLDIESDTSQRDCKALESVVQMVLRDGIKVLEIGSWKGMTTSVLAKTVKDFGGSVFAVDNWEGCSTPHHRNQVGRIDVFSVFRQNIEILGFSDFVYPMFMDSLVASTIFADGSLDLVFIDADHKYGSAKQDIEIWLPKVKRGGVICGHDCQEYYTKLGSYKEVVDSHLSEEVIPGICHPGVTRALFDVFGDDYSIVPGSSIWWRRA